MCISKIGCSYLKMIFEQQQKKKVVLGGLD